MRIIALLPRLIMVGGLVTTSLAAAAPVTIWPLGDSITDGWSTTTVATPGGYREPLYERLTAAGMTVDYVGAQTDNPGPTLLAQGQVQHDGYPKYRIRHLIDNLDGNVQPPSTADTGNMPSNNGGYWLTGKPGLRAPINPDIMLLLIGTNDVGDEFKAGTPDAQIAPMMDNLLDQLLTKLFGYLPHTHLYLASLPPYPLPQDAAKDAVTREYDQYVAAQAVPKFQSLGYRVTFVDQYANFVLPTGDVDSALYGDTIHPNAAGYELMGATWAAAIVPEPLSVLPLSGITAGLLLLRRARRPY